MNKQTRYWIGVACKKHIENGKKLGIAQFCHGKYGPAKRPSKADFVIYYSPKITMEGNEIYQKFTALGEVTDDTPYQDDMGDGFMPFRRNIKYLDTQDIDIKPLIHLLPFIKNKKSWGYVFRYGFLEIDLESFEIIKKEMIINKDLEV